MFKEMRRKEKEMSEDRLNEILKTGEYGVLSVLDSTGYPYGVPVNYVFVEGKLYVHCAKVGAKLEAILKNPKVSFNIVATHGLIAERFTSFYESVTLFGQAKLIEGEETVPPLKAFIDKYSSDYREGGYKYAEGSFKETMIIEVTPAHITGKSSNMPKGSESC